MRLARSSRLVATSFGLAALALSAPAQAQLQGFANSSGLTSPQRTVTFEEVVVGSSTPVTTQFSAYGVTFSPGLFYTSGPSSVPGITGAWLANVNSAQDGGIVNPFSILFTAPVAGAAFAWSNQTLNPPAVTTTFTALLNGTPVAQFFLPQTFNDPARAYVGFQPGSIRGAEFNEIRVSIDRSSVAWLDNVQANTSTVPEPSSLVLLATGLLVAGGIVRGGRTKA